MSTTTIIGRDRPEQEACNWLLNLQVNNELWCLDVGRLLTTISSSSSSSNSKPPFRVVRGTEAQYGTEEFPEGDSLPLGSRYIFLGGKPYAVGGFLFEDKFRHEEKGGAFVKWANLEVYACEIHDCYPSIFLHPSGLPILSGPKINPIVATIDGKIYVLSTLHFGYVGTYHPSLFEVFDPATRVWKALPNPPFPRYYSADQTVFVEAPCTLERDLVVLHSQSGRFFKFDTFKEEWEPAFLEEPVFGFVQHKEVLIAIPSACKGVYTYQMGRFGPIRHREICELTKVFKGPQLEHPTALLAPIAHTGLILLLCAGFESPHKWRVRVTVFQVVTSATKPSLATADIKALETYYFKPDGLPIISSYSISNTEADPIWKTGILAECDTIATGEDPKLDGDEPVEDPGCCHNRAASYWLSLVKRAEKAENLMLCVEFFKLALEARCKPLERMLERLYYFVGRYGHSIELHGDILRELLRSYHRVISDEQNSAATAECEVSLVEIESAEETSSEEETSSAEVENIINIAFTAAKRKKVVEKLRMRLRDFLMVRDADRSNICNA